MSSYWNAGPFLILTLQIWDALEDTGLGRGGKSHQVAFKGLVGCKLRQDSPGDWKYTEAKGNFVAGYCPRKYKGEKQTHQIWVIAINKNSFVSPEWWNQGKLALNLQNVHMDAVSKPYTAIVLFLWKKFSHHYLFVILCSVQNGSHWSFVFVVYLKCSWSELKFFINVNYTSISENIV